MKAVLAIATLAVLAAAYCAATTHPPFQSEDAELELYWQQFQEDHPSSQQ
jgi:hypothetical protein